MLARVQSGRVWIRLQSFVFFVFILIATVTASKELQASVSSGVSLLAGYDSNGVVLEPTTRIIGQFNHLGLLGGIVLDSRLSEGTGLDWGILLGQKGFHLKFPSEQTEDLLWTVAALQLQFRMYFIPALSCAFGFYGSYAWPMELVSNQNRHYESFDYGFSLSLQLRVELLGPFDLVGDIRYFAGLADLSRDTTEILRLAGLQGMMGLRWRI